MVFSSLLFMFVYFAIVLAVYYIIPRKVKNLWLFVVSILFYGFGEPAYVFLMLFAITVNYITGLLFSKWQDKQKIKKVILVLNVIFNLGMLGFFKYTGFALGMFNKIPGLEIAVPEIALPIGISFYTFQTMSYIIDVYWGNCEVQKNYITFGTYVVLFPQLIAGPIVRYIDVEYQLQHRKETTELFAKGVKLFALGLAKKVLIANQMGLLWTQLKGDTESGIIGSWIGIIAFTLQIYFDFSGYSDMARGLGNFFGFEFVQNFEYPYVSQSITDFWRRWHISLSSWFKEYVYIPLGGNRKGKPRQVFNTMVVWMLTGLWHGASWNFVLWGVYFGVLLIIEKFLLKKILDRLPAFFRHVYALFFIIMGWVVFDFTEIGEMGTFIVRLFTGTYGIVSGDALSLVLSYLPVIIIGIGASLPVWKKLYFRTQDKTWSFVLQCVSVIAVLVLATASLVSSSYNPFLYFRF
ncbi:MAG: MBOAT family protein [Clostridia bacterium]|nr:MBOAT family protein [Clostridia bacterium]